MITILFVDHSIENDRSVRQLLAGRRANNFKLDRVVSYREVLNGFRSKAYDVCLIDSGFDNGLKLFARARGVGCTAPIVLVTANNAGEVLEAIRSGVADCLIRDELDASRIERALCSVVEQARGVSLQIKRERRYLALMDNADEIISTHDLEGNFTSINRTGEQLIGYSQEEILARNFTEIVAPEYRDLLKKMIEQTRVGSNHTQRVDVRVIAASNRNVEEEVDAGRFRKDLFYRLNAVSIVLPPLRERKEDILLLAKSFAERVYSLSPEVKFSLEALELLEQYTWPGNIRELENAVVRATAICDGVIRVKDLPERVQKFKVRSEGDSTPENGAGEAGELPFVAEWTSLSTIEGRYVEKVLAHTGGNKQAAARLLHVDRKTLDRMIKRHKISVERGAKLPSKAA